MPGDIPEAVGGVVFSDNDDLSILVDFDVVFCKQGDAVIIASLADGNKGTGL